MATPQLSPGLLVREVDLTVGRADNVLDNIGAIAGPFELGPVNEAIDISTEQDLINTFGKPLSTDRQYEYWMSGSSYLSYGGVLKVVRTDGTTLKNANAGVGMANTTTLKVKNNDDYEENYQTATNFTWAAKNPGTWANGLKVAIIDNAADQRLGISTVAFGDGSTATANAAGALVAGDNATAEGDESSAFGFNALATQANAYATGTKSRSLGVNAHAMGTFAHATNANTLAYGMLTTNAMALAAPRPRA